MWGKPLAGGAAAVALLNRGSVPLRITTTASTVGLAAAATYTVRDLWAHRSTESHGAIGAIVPPDSAMLLPGQPGVSSVGEGEHGGDHALQIAHG